MPGERAVIELLLAAPERIERLLVLAGTGSPKLQDLAGRVGLVLQPATRSELDALAGPNVARGVIAIARPPKLWDLEDLLLPRTNGPRLLVALDGVLDPQNVGAMLRSAEFFGARGMFWAKDRSAGLTPTLVRASVGASERLQIAVVGNLVTALEACKQAGFWVVGTVVDGGEPLGEVVDRHLVQEDVVMVFGSEERGLRRLTRERCDFLASIPRCGEIGSLNVSAAAAITLARWTEHANRAREA